MKTSSCLTCLAILTCALLAGAPGVRADETVRRAQQALHDQGFYYGSIDGTSGDETTQAVRRFQIRNGLAVTGQLNDETLRALQLGGGAASPPRGGKAAPPAQPRNPNSGPPPVISGRPERGTANPEATPPPLAPPPQARKEPRPPPQAPATPPDATYSRPDLRAIPPPAGAEPPPARSSLPPNAVAPSLSLQQFFNGTPFEFAPPPVQSEIVRRAQLALRREGLYRGEADGVPGAMTGAAIAEFQSLNGQRRTGRLDGTTLRLLRLSLQPGHRATPQPFYSDDFDDEEDADLRRFRRYRPRRGPTVYEGRIVE